MSLLPCEDISDSCSEGQSDPDTAEELGHLFETNTLRVGSSCNTLSLLTLCDAIAAGWFFAPSAVTVAGLPMATPRGWWEDKGPTEYNFIKSQRLAQVINDHVATLKVQCASLEGDWQLVRELGTRALLAERKKSEKHITLERLRMEIDLLMTARKSLDR